MTALTLPPTVQCYVWLDTATTQQLAMESTNPMKLDCCPLCLKKGKRSSLTFFRLSLKESALLCSNMKCPFPLGTDYDDVFIEHEINDSDDDISEGSGSDVDIILKTFPLLGSRVTDSSQKENGNVDEAVESLLPSMNLHLEDNDSTFNSGSSISQDKSFSSITPTDDIHKVLKTSDHLEFDDIESIYLSANSSILSEEGFEEFNSMLSDIEFQESSKMTENRSPSSKTRPSKNNDISENHVSSSMLNHVNSTHSSDSKALYSPSSKLSHNQDVKQTLPQISPIEKIEVWMKDVPDPKSDTAIACEKLIPELKPAGNNSATVLCTEHSSDLSPNNDSCSSASNNQECPCDNTSSKKWNESLDTQCSVHKDDDNIFKLDEIDILDTRGDNISDLCSTSENGQELSVGQSSENHQRITHLNSEHQSSEENTLDVLTLVQNDRSENSLCISANHMPNFGVSALSSTNSESSNDHQSSVKHLETYKLSSPIRSTENENMSYAQMSFANDNRDNIPSTSRYDLLKSSQSSVTNKKESSSDQQYRKRLPKTFDTISTPARTGNENLSDSGPSFLCAESKNQSYSFRKEQAPLGINSYLGTKLPNGMTGCFSSSSSNVTNMCCDTFYNNSCQNINQSCNELQCIYSETSNKILDVCNLLPQQDRSVEHMSEIQSSSTILNTVIIECTENIPLPSACDLGANVVEFSMVRGDSEGQEVYYSYKMVKCDSQCASSIPDDHTFSCILECEHCRTLSTEQSICMCCEHCRTTSTEQSQYQCCETRMWNYNEQKDIPCTSLWPPPADSTGTNCCVSSHILQCKECPMAKVSSSSCSNIPPVPSNIERSDSNQMEVITSKELPHVQEPIVSQETNSTENSNPIDPNHCVFQQTNVNHITEAEIKSNTVQKNKRTRKRKNKRSCVSQQKGKVANKPRLNRKDVVASVVRLDVSDFNDDLELTL